MSDSERGRVSLAVGLGIASLVVASLALIAALRGPAAGAAPPETETLTAADRVEIQELLHRYMFVLDSCPDHANGQDYAALYTDDGVFHSQDVQFGMKVTGRQALAELAAGAPEGCGPIRRRGATNQVHINVAPIVVPSPEGARGISYLLMIDGPGHEIYWNGWYQDVYSKTPNGWRFKSRLHVGGNAVGVPVPLAAARGLWEREPTPEGSRALIGKSPDRPEPLAGDPLKWLLGAPAPAASQ
jgi:hypothetical protein